MKRFCTLLLTLLMLTALLSACGECSHEYDNATDYLCNDCDHNRLLGTWTTTIEGAPGEMTLNADFTGQITSNGLSRAGFWSLDGTTLSVMQNVGGYTHVFLDNVTFSLGETTLTVTSQNGNQLVFEKK